MEWRNEGDNDCFSLDCSFALINTWAQLSTVRSEDPRSARSQILEIRPVLHANLLVEKTEMLECSA